MSDALSALLDDLERWPELDRPEHLRERVEALDRLERLAFYLPDTHEGAALLARAQALQTRLEAANDALYRSLRETIRRGDGASTLHAWQPREPDIDGTDETQASHAQGEGYDHLDMLLGGVLQLAEPTDEVPAPAPEMVFYQPTPARHIFDLIRRLALDEHDVLIDLGSGLGHVPLLIGLCTPARCIGVELEPAYVASAQRSADELALKRVSFVQADAREADLSQANVFYLYTPFVGGVLDEMLELIRAQAGQRAIRLCSLGPCTQRLAAQTWLRPLDARLYPDRIAVFVPRASV